ncbi:unnamed protein product [Calypogeia fissa]
MAKRLIPDKVDVSPSSFENTEGYTGDNDGSEVTSTTATRKSTPRHHSPNWQSVKKSAQRKFVSTVEKIMTLSRRDSWTGIPKDLLVDPPELPIVQLGPVIGKVTQNSARILLEISETGKVAIVLEKESPPLANHMHKSHPSMQKMLLAGRPGIFVFENLDPGTRYIVKLKGCQKSASQCSSFCTFPAESCPSVNFAVISCNKIFITEKEIPSHSDLWCHLAKAIEQGKIDMCLHLGDQIYGDGDKMLDAEVGLIPGDWSDCFRKSKAALASLPKHQWEEQEEKICESYRTIYRRTWSHAPTAYCLANCPNLMIYDDHEVRDNWADLPGDWNSSTMDFFIARCAWKVNLEYQRQLHEDVNLDHLELIDKDYHFHLISGVGLMFLDIRGSRTFHRVPGDPCKYLGSKQWQDIEKALKGGIFESARALLVCTPAPLVFLEHNFTDVVANRVSRLEDFKGHWSAAPHFPEQKKMVDILCEWKRTFNTREVLVLGGDVHCGGHSDIVKDHQMVYRQLTTSAIANHSLPKSAYYLLRAAGTLSGVGQPFSFRHHNWTRSRNYGIVKIGPPPEGTTRPELTAQLIKGKFMIGIREGLKVSNQQEGRAGCFGCFL